MKHPDQPDTSPDNPLADAAYAHKRLPPDEPGEGVSPLRPSTMPRGEDDEDTMKQSPEFHDRPGSPWAPKK